MANKVLEGHERRQHDEECQARSIALKEWVALKICIATKPTRTKQAVMWAILLLILGSSSLMTGYSAIGAADQKAQDVQQSSDIEHNEQQIKVITAQHKELVDNTETLAKTVFSIREQQIEVQINQKHLMETQTKMLGILERIDRNVQ